MTNKIRRRGFLKQSAIATAVAALAGKMPKALAAAGAPTQTNEGTVEALIARMTLEEKIQMGRGAGPVQSYGRQLPTRH